MSICCRMASMSSGGNENSPVTILMCLSVLLSQLGITPLLSDVAGVAVSLHAL